MKNKSYAVKRIFDLLLSVFAAVILSPIMIIAAAGIKISDRGPVLYKAKRMGKEMNPIDIYKFRTMRVNSDRSGSITAKNDSRVFLFGRLLRKTKIDELPQLFNILNGSMSVIGPRPEDVGIVNKYYSDEQKRTLKVLPGLASPGSIFNYTHGDRYLSDTDTDQAYIEKLMPIKLAMDLYYVDNWTLWYDVELIFRTIMVIILRLLGKRKFSYPKEYAAEKCRAER